MGGLCRDEELLINSFECFFESWFCTSYTKVANRPRRDNTTIRCSIFVYRGTTYVVVSFQP